MSLCKKIQVCHNGLSTFRSLEIHDQILMMIKTDYRLRFQNIDANSSIVLCLGKLSIVLSTKLASQKNTIHTTKYYLSK